jgi:AbrB family looped-hinge helix DNA binding protein
LEGGCVVEVSRISSKGQVTIPKTIRELLNLNEGDRVAFLEENGKIMITKASLIALNELQVALSKEAKEKSISEEELLNELKAVREELWNERKK